MGNDDEQKKTERFLIHTVVFVIVMVSFVIRETMFMNFKTLLNLKCRNSDIVGL